MHSELQTLPVLLRDVAGWNVISLQLSGRVPAQEWMCSCYSAPQGALISNTLIRALGLLRVCGAGLTEQ